MGPLADPESEGALLLPHQPPLPRLPDQVQAVVAGAGLNLVLVKQGRHNLNREGRVLSPLTDTHLLRTGLAVGVDAHRRVFRWSEHRSLSVVPVKIMENFQDYHKYLLRAQQLYT